MSLLESARLSLIFLPKFENFRQPSSVHIDENKELSKMSIQLPRYNYNKVL